MQHRLRQRGDGRRRLLHDTATRTRPLVRNRMRDTRGQAQDRLLRVSAQRSTSRGVAWLGGGLGVAQLIAWGTIYYAIAVLGEPMQRDLALSRSELYGLFTWSLALAGLLAPSAGRLVDRPGGRTILVAGAVLGSLGFLVLALAQSLWMLGIGWTLEGGAMALGLYDTCFAALGQAAPHAYRRAVTAVTLIAGLASTCFGRSPTFWSRRWAGAQRAAPSLCSCCCACRCTCWCSRPMRAAHRLRARVRPPGSLMSSPGSAGERECLLSHSRAPPW